MHLSLLLDRYPQLRDAIDHLTAQESTDILAGTRPDLFGGFLGLLMPAERFTDEQLSRLHEELCVRLQAKIEKAHGGWGATMPAGQA